jgi:molybdate transport system regulatory protein
MNEGGGREAEGRRHRLSIRSKVWLEVGGKPVLGEGRKRLLEAIERLGSITRAASEVGISYRRAWSHLQAMESRLRVKLVNTQRGGKHGGWNQAHRGSEVANPGI